jgi:uncharacterized protein
VTTKPIDWIQTFTGRRVRPLAARPSDIDIRDIAHALAHQCRFSGHVREFYSVAEHSVMVSLEVTQKYALAGLLHDAAEAYLVDLPTPIKHLLPVYAKMEEKLFGVIARKFFVPTVIAPVIKWADRRILEMEARALMNGSLKGWRMMLGFESPIIEALSRPLPPNEAELLFLTRFKDLTGQDLT